MKDRMDIYKEDRPWGSFTKFTENTPSTVKIITVKPNEELSLQSHKERSEFWHVISGSGFFEINGKIEKVEVGSEEYFGIGDKHRMGGGENGIQVLEIAFGHFDEKGDIIRYDDKYGRV
jgi:mannose-6-phosphate isomerase-like protein (cupin superfamily)